MNPLRETILIVDDEPAFRRALTSVLDARGYRVLATGSPDVAYQLLGMETVDAILLDVGLPTMSGLALQLAIVHRWPRMADRIALMTGDPYSMDVLRWQREHGGTILAKPFLAGQLSEWLAGVLAQSMEHKAAV
jgi:two-component system, OmpR family, alkaline phosphatase synthesis response regulator PhoP